MNIELNIKVIRKLYFEDFRGIYAVSVDSEDRDKVELNNYGNISIKGEMHELTIGDTYTVEVEKEASQYKGSYLLKQIKPKELITLEEQKLFLESILTPYQIKNIFDYYNNGENIIELIKNNQFNYNEITGLGEKSYLKIKDKILDNLEVGKALAYFSKYKIGYNLIMRIVKEHGSSELAIKKISENPYILTKFNGIGFLTADDIAIKMGFNLESEHRIKSCLFYVLTEIARDGHTWVNERALINKAVSLLEISSNLILDVLNNNVDGIVKKDDRYALKLYYEAEQRIAKFIYDRIQDNHFKLFPPKEIDDFLERYCSENNVTLEEEQYNFFHNWNNYGVSLLVGSGGTGKTWLLNILLKMVKEKFLSTLLLAPTGRASKVMSNHTKHHAFTIHRGIGLRKGSLIPSSVIDENILLIDETSMCDVLLIDSLFKAIINKDTKILFVGDDFQLPSVGAGNFLFDLINNNKIKVSRLTKVFRQEDDGALEVSTNVKNNHKFLNYSDNGKIKFGKDCLIHLVEQDYIEDGYKHYYKRALKKYKPEDIIILTPTRKGKFGTVNINKVIQEIANPASPMKKQKIFGEDEDLIFRVGDLIMNENNMYDVSIYKDGVYEENENMVTDIFNGDIGKIVDIDENEKVFILDFDGVKIKVKYIDLIRKMSHAWAITIHKSQGSAFPVVISIIDKSAKFQLNANLMYTAFSRVEDFEIILGQVDAINFGMDKFANKDRNSFLREMLNEF